MRPLTKTLALAAAVLATCAADAAACSCIQVDDRTKLRQADAAMVGKLVRVTPHGPGNAARFRYAIVSRHKGLSSRQRFVEVHSTTQSASCGLPTVKGRRSALYLDRADGRWNSGLCQQTTHARMKAAARARQSSAAGASVPCAA